MKKLFILITMLCFTVNVTAQWYTVNNLSGTSAVYGTTTVGVLGGGTFSTYPGWCGAIPYWIGDGTGGTPDPGHYTFSFSPAATSIRIFSTASDPGESIAIHINGVLYVITLANLTAWTSTCGTPVMTIVGDSLVSVAGNSSAELNITYCPIDSIEVETDGISNGTVFTFMFSDSGACFRAWNNSPCVGDTLFLDAIGDSIGATYAWTGPGGFTSTQKNPFIFPATFPDSGVYRVIRTIDTAIDTATTDVIIHPTPIVNASNNSPLCAGLVDTLKLNVLPALLDETFSWSGPASYSALGQTPTIPGFTAADTGIYKVVATTLFGCMDSSYTDVGLVPPPPAPLITGPTAYCQGVPFVPFTVTGYTGSLLWYSTRAGGVGDTIATVINTGLPGIYHVWVSQIIGSCESPRDSITVKVTVTPPPPPVTGTMQYCQYIGSFAPLTVHTTTTGVALWYTSPTGGTSSTTEPSVNISVAGTYNFWVSQIDSGCEGSRTPVTIVVHPKPAPPVITKQKYCQYAEAIALIATLSETGDFFTWFGAGIPTGGTLLTPFPQTDIPKLDSYYVNETSVYGCVSDSALDTVRIVPNPPAPHTTDTVYCQTFPAAPLNYGVDSAGITAGTHLNWYYNGLPVGSAPVPPTTVPGNMTWYVSQTVNNCQGDSAAITVTTIFLPVFTITASSPWVCQSDSITLSYNGPALANAAYQWVLPAGDSFATGSNSKDSMILVKYDSATTHAYTYLTASDDNGRCFTTDTISIKVVAHPVAVSYTKADVCLGDTVSLGLATESEDATKFIWNVDYTTLLTNSPELNIISADSRSSGPFLISWLDTGRHVIQLNSFTEEGCTSLPTFDTVNVHTPPDASFTFKYSSASLCLEDSVYFTANNYNYNNSYTWSPAHSFSNINKPEGWGRLEQTQSIIMLTVTDPFGCTATTSEQLDPGTCCTVAFPNAFTPNGDGHDDKFKPLFTGYHNFHVFRIVNRWGQTVFESTNGTMQWDGTFNGVPQDMGVYFYYLKYDCGGQTIEESGDVTLIR